LREDGNFLREEDLVLVGDFLCNVFPENAPVSMGMLYLLHDPSRRFDSADSDVTPKVWSKFLQRLLDSPRPVVNAYGQIGWLSDQLFRQKQATDAMLAEAGALAAAANSPPLSQLDPQGQLHHSAVRLADWIELALHPPKLGMPALTAPHEKGPLRQEDGSILCDRVRLKPVKLLANNNAASSPADGYRKPLPALVCDELFKAWDGMDVIKSRYEVSYLTKDFNCKLVFSDSSGTVGNAVFDGHNVWVSTASGVYALDRSGSKISVSLADGLPESVVPIPLIPLNPGRVMAAGCIQQSRRGWLATIELEQGAPRVKVFHEGIKMPHPNSKTSPPNLDPSVNFEPEWLIEHFDETKKRWVFVGRNHNPQPLLVDVATLEVSVYPAGAFDHGCFPRLEITSGSFWSQDGLLYVAGSYHNYKSFRFDPMTHIFSEVPNRPDSQWHWGNAMHGCIVANAGYLYYAGDARWLRCPLGSGPDELLVASPSSLPRHGWNTGWTLGVSNIAGLVAWSDGQLYQVTVEAGANEAVAR
jgi:hypothetical protein